MHDLHSEATSMGMRRWWRKQPLCLACGKVHIRNPLVSRLCAKCRRRSQKVKRDLPPGGVRATIVLNLSNRFRSPYRLEGWLHQTAGGFEFSNDLLTLSLDEEDFEIVEVHEQE